MREGTGPQDTWAIVVADDHGPECAPSIGRIRRLAPVQYESLSGAATLLQRALHRAARLVRTSHLLVTAREDYREHWGLALWFVRPECRFVWSDRLGSWLTTAAALLKIGRDSPSGVVVILPARCFVADEGILSTALDQALALLPWVPEGVITLGMRNIEGEVDEDYLLPAPRARGPARPLVGIARQPVAWIARHLREHGALVASQILVAYVGALTAHVSRHSPGLTSTLVKLVELANFKGIETRIPLTLQRGMSAELPRSLRWYPPSLPQRALYVPHCGWSGLRSANSVARIRRFVAMSHDPGSTSRTSAEEERAEQYHRKP